MKIIKQLLVNGEEVGLISDETRLELSSPGRARFLVQSDKALAGVVQFSVGWSGMSLHRLFVGYIDKPTTINDKQQLLFCRELSAALNRPLPMGLRLCPYPFPTLETKEGFTACPILAQLLNIALHSADPISPIFVLFYP